MCNEHPGYTVYDASGKAVYTSPYLVQVTISDLNIRKGVGTNYGITGKFTRKGVFTIVEEANGSGASGAFEVLSEEPEWLDFS